MEKLYAGLLVYLAMETHSDITSKTISVRNGMIAGITALILRIWMGKLTWDMDGILFLLKAMIPAGGLFLVSRLTRQAVGYGDAILILVCGLYLGGKLAAVLFACGLFCLFPVALGLLLFGKASGKEELPFAPFLLSAFLLWVI